MSLRSTLLADNLEMEPPPQYECDESSDSSSVDDEFIDNSDDEDVYFHPVTTSIGDCLDLSAGNYHGDDSALSEPLLFSKKSCDGEHEVKQFKNETNDSSGQICHPKHSLNEGENNQKLILSFILLILIGTANNIFQKLQAIPMYNYPNSLNLVQLFLYVPLCFIYIFPVAHFKWFGNAIPREATIMSKRPFAIMGLLDCITCILMTFASVYLPGSLLILLPQAAIPISMILSNRIKGEKYGWCQYLGAVVVVIGIFVILEPLMTQRHVPDYICQAFNEDEFCAVCVEEVTEESCLSHRNVQTAHTSGSNSVGLLQTFGEMSLVPVQESNNATDSSSAMENSTDTSSSVTGEICQWVPTSSVDSSSSSSTVTLLIWSIVTILACIPRTLSSIYKEMVMATSTQNIDPVFLNGWVALFQFLHSFPLAVPAGMMSKPPITPSELPLNIWNGIKCYVGIPTVTAGCHPDDQCPIAPIYVNMSLLFSIIYSMLMVYILKFGSANVLFMAGTVMVPIGNLAFSLPFMPGSMPLHDSDVLGLLVILSGLVTYRFGRALKCKHYLKKLRFWRWGKKKNRRMNHTLAASVGINHSTASSSSFEWNAPIFEDSYTSEDNVIISEPLLLKPLD